MNTKLTLNIDQNVIEEAKSYAKKDDYKNDILYEYSFNDYYKEVKLKGLISWIFNF